MVEALKDVAEKFYKLPVEIYVFQEGEILTDGILKAFLDEQDFKLHPEDTDKRLYRWRGII